MIRVFSGPTADHVWRQMTDAFRRSDGICSQESRDGPTKEILHAAISIEDPRQRWVVSRKPPINVAFALAEIVWIMNGRRDLKFLKFWNRGLPRFVGPGPKLHGAYGHRLRIHLGLDQLKRAYEVLRQKPDTRQAVLQIWDSSIDLPRSDGSPVDQDIPCNILSLLKVRDRKLEWTQIIRSNDVFLGVPYNFVQFTCLQEIIAGWLGIECGSYNQISDSLHLYDRDIEKVFNSIRSSDQYSNPDSLTLPWEESEQAFKEMESRIEQMIKSELCPAELEKLSKWDTVPQAYQNILAVLVATVLHRHNREKAKAVMASCTNPVYRELWSQRFLNEIGKTLC